MGWTHRRTTARRGAVQGGRRGGWLSLVLALVAALSSVAAAPGDGKQDGTQTFVAPYDGSHQSPSAKDDPTTWGCGVNLECTISANARWRSGNTDASASITATGVPTDTNETLAFSGARISENYQLHAGWETVTYTATFDVTSAQAQAGLGSAGEVRAVVQVSHDRCEDCVVEMPEGCSAGYCIIAAERSMTSVGETDSFERKFQFPVTVTLKRPEGGEIPKGRVQVDASLEAVVATFGPLFTGTVKATVDGAVAQIAVQYDAV